jgi:hypothetical protein
MESNGSALPLLMVPPSASLGGTNIDKDGFTRSPKTSFSTRSDNPLGPTGSLKITGSLFAQDAETASEADSNDSEDESSGKEMETKDQDTGAEEPTGGDSKQPKEEKAAGTKEPAGGNPEPPKEEKQAAGAEKPAGGSAQVAQTIDVSLLLKNSKTVIEGKNRLFFFVKMRHLDPLSCGPSGIHVNTLEEKASAVEANVVPRWMCVVASYFDFPEKLTLKHLNKWSEVLASIEDALLGEEDDHLHSRIKDEVDKKVREFAKRATIFMQSLEDSIKLKAKTCDPVSRIDALFGRFSREVNSVIEEEIHKHSMAIVNERHLDLLQDGH